MDMTYCEPVLKSLGFLIAPKGYVNRIEFSNMYATKLYKRAYIKGLTNPYEIRADISTFGDIIISVSDSKGNEMAYVMPVYYKKTIEVESDLIDFDRFMTMTADLCVIRGYK